MKHLRLQISVGEHDASNNGPHHGDSIDASDDELFITPATLGLVLEALRAGREKTIHANALNHVIDALDIL